MRARIVIGYQHYTAKVDESETPAPHGAKKNLEKKKKGGRTESREAIITPSCGGYQWIQIENTLGSNAYIRGFPRQRLCKAGLARLMQPVSRSLNNACDIRAAQTKCTFARTVYVCVYKYIQVYICTRERTYMQQYVYAFWRVRRWNHTVIRMIYTRWTVGFETRRSAGQVLLREASRRWIRLVHIVVYLRRRKRDTLRVKAALTAILTASCYTDGAIFTSATAVLRSITRSSEIISQSVRFARRSRALLIRISVVDYMIS